MKYQAIQGYLQVISGGLALLAGVVLIVLQWGNQSAFSLYGQNRNINTALLMVCCVVGGLAAPWVCKLVYRGVVILYKSRGPDTPGV